MNENFFEMIPKEDSYKIKKSSPIQKVDNNRRELQRTESRCHPNDRSKNFSQFLREAEEKLGRESQKKNEVKEAKM